MVAAEGLHDGGLVQELDSLPQVGRLVHCFDCNMRLPLALNNVLGDALVDHAEGALAQFPQNGDLLSGHLPLVLLVHCRQHISSNALLGRSFTMAEFTSKQENFTLMNIHICCCSFIIVLFSLRLPLTPVITSNVK